MTAEDRTNFGIESDVCLILEGTYPYVQGGVSTWVEQMLLAMPDVRFAIFFLGANKEAARQQKYNLPDNVIAFREEFLFDEERPAKESQKTIEPADEALIHEACDSLLGCFERENDNSAHILGAFGLFAELTRRIDFGTFWKHPRVWHEIKGLYEAHFPTESFVDYFWNTKFLISPLWRTLQCVRELPSAKLYHSVSTGYAGLLGALAKSLSGRPFLLSEHGIYIRERIADLLRSEWDAGLKTVATSSNHPVSPLRLLWVELFIQLGKATYDTATEIVSLFDRNANLQMEFGASQQKIRIIPNGVNPGRFLPYMQKREALLEEHPERKTVGFFGRVVAIKDVKTLIRAARLTCNAIPDAKFLIVGPKDEEEEYSRDCEALVEELNLGQNVTMPGKGRAEDILPLFDVMVLSSLSEGLPFAILEAFGTGIPVASTDVGSCSQLVYGAADENPALGPAGIIVPPGDASELARALIELLSNRELRLRYGAVGRSRIEASYDESQVIEAYKSLYFELATAHSAGEPPSKGSGMTEILDKH